MDDIFDITLHGECLARAGRPVHENSAVLAVQEGTAKGWAIDLREHLLLRSVLVQHLLKGVHFVLHRMLVAPVALSDDDLCLVAVDL